MGRISRLIKAGIMGCDGGDGSGGFGVRVRVRDSGCQCFR